MSATARQLWMAAFMQPPRQAKSVPKTNQVSFQPEHEGKCMESPSPTQPWHFFFFSKSAVLDLTFCWQQATIHKPKMVLKLVICTTQFFKLTKGTMRPYHADFSWKISVSFHWIGQNSGVSFTLNALSSFLKMFWKSATSQKAQAPTLVNWRSSKTSVLNDFFLAR